MGLLIFKLLPQAQLISLHHLPAGKPFQFVFGIIKEKKASTPHSAKHLRSCFILSMSGSEVCV